MKSIIKMATLSKMTVLALSIIFASPIIFADEQQQFDPAQFARGVKSWADNCSRCHRMRDPKEFRDDEWKVIVTHMQIRAGLTKKEAEDILKFLEKSN